MVAWPPGTNFEVSRVPTALSLGKRPWERGWILFDLQSFLSPEPSLPPGLRALARAKDDSGYT